MGILDDWPGGGSSTRRSRPPLRIRAIITRSLTPASLRLFSVSVSVAIHPPSTSISATRTSSVSPALVSSMTSRMGPRRGWTGPRWQPWQPRQRRAMAGTHSEPPAQLPWVRTAMASDPRGSGPGLEAPCHQLPVPVPRTARCHPGGSRRRQERSPFSPGNPPGGQEGMSIAPTSVIQEIGMFSRSLAVGLVVLACMTAAAGGAYFAGRQRARRKVSGAGQVQTGSARRRSGSGNRGGRHACRPAPRCTLSKADAPPACGPGREARGAIADARPPAARADPSRAGPSSAAAPFTAPVPPSLRGPPPAPGCVPSGRCRLRRCAPSARAVGPPDRPPEGREPTAAPGAPSWSSSSTPRRRSSGCRSRRRCRPRPPGSRTASKRG